MLLNRAGRSYRLLVIVALAGLIATRVISHLILYRSGFESLTADEFGRIVLAAQWAQKPYLSWSGVWLPFHLYMFGTALQISRELLVVPRVVVATAGAVGIVVMYYLAFELFQSRRVALVAAFLLCVNPVHLWLSSTPLSEVPQTTLGLAALLGLAVYLKRRSFYSLAISGLMLALANGFRFESWMLSLVWSLVIVSDALIHQRSDKRNWRQLFKIWGVAALPWLVPAAWIAGNYLYTGDPLYFRHSITAYKALWYGQDADYARYLHTFRRIDPIAVTLLLPAIAVCVIRHRSVWILRCYVVLAVLPWCIFAVLHGGQPEPPGNYLRYLAPFLFPIYPLIAYVLYLPLKIWIKNERVRVACLALILCGYGLLQTRASLQYTNDPAAAGLKVGQRIRELRGQAPFEEQRPVLIELSYWQYLAVHVGANDVSRLIYDRPLNINQRNTPSLFLSDFEAMRVCISQHDIGLLVVKSPEVRQVIESRLELLPAEEINGYSFYHTREALTSALTATSATPCPLSFGTGY